MSESSVLTLAGEPGLLESASWAGTLLGRSLGEREGPAG